MHGKANAHLKLLSEFHMNPPNITKKCWWDRMGALEVPHGQPLQHGAGLHRQPPHLLEQELAVLPQIAPQRFPAKLLGLSNTVHSF